MVSSHFHPQDAFWGLQLAESEYVNKENAICARLLENNRDRESFTGGDPVYHRLGHTRHSNVYWLNGGVDE